MMSAYVRGRVMRSVEERNAVQTASARLAKSPCESRPPPPQPVTRSAPAEPRASERTAKRCLVTPPASQMSATEPPSYPRRTVRLPVHCGGGSLAVSEAIARGVETVPRQRILDSAYERFSRRGVRGVGIEEVIERATVAKATLYRHFPSAIEFSVERYCHRGCCRVGRSPALNVVGAGARDAGEPSSRRGHSPGERRWRLHG
jgi:hypothetical protein